MKIKKSSIFLLVLLLTMMIFFKVLRNAYEVSCGEFSSWGDYILVIPIISSILSFISWKIIQNNFILACFLPACIAILISFLLNRDNCDPFLLQKIVATIMGGFISWGVYQFSLIINP